MVLKTIELKEFWCRFVW